MINFTIRNGTVSDNKEVENVTREAFWNLHVPGCDEHYVIHKIKEHSDYLPELDYVAVSDNRIIGCIVFTKSYLEDTRGDRLDTSFPRLPPCVMALPPILANITVLNSENLKDAVHR